MDFFIDNTGLTEDQEILNKEIKEIIDEFKESIQKKEVVKPKKLSIYENFENEIGWTQIKKGKKWAKVIDEVTPVRKEVGEVLKKSIITPQFEELLSIPPYEVAEKHRKILQKKEAAKTKGSKWYGLPATEVTKEIKQNLQVLQMRSALDPKRFYKKNDLKILPKYFQVGKVIDSPLDYYNSRLTKKERKSTLVDELLADAEFNKYNKRKYKEIIEEKQKTNYKAWKEAKKSKKTKKKNRK